MNKTFSMLALALTLLGAPAMAQAAEPAAPLGPVATACKDDIAKLCAGKPHDGEVRACLESQKDKVTESCRHALETTGGGHGKGMGMGQGNMQRQ